MWHVLVVDDDADSAEGLVRLIERRGHRATWAPNGREALSALMNRSPNLVVLDLRMPQMDGLMFLEVVRSYLRFQDLPVLLLTAYPAAPEVARARKLGVAAVFQKATGFTPLLDAIDGHVPAHLLGETARGGRPATP